jgi:hypothetical protein
MSKVLTIACNVRRLAEVNSLLRARGHVVRGADTRSTMRHLLSLEPFQQVIVIDELPPTYAEALRTELRAGRLSPRIIHAETVRAEEIPELLSQVANLPLAA